MNTYYVYAYLRLNGTPYYIGKGIGSRAWVKGKGEIGKPTNLSRIIIIERNLTNVGALAIERRLIKWYGRIDQGTGILRNKTDGGDGLAGYKFTEDRKKAMSDRLSGIKKKPRSEETKRKLREANLGKHIAPFTESHKQKISQALKGKVRSEEHSKNLSKANKGRSPGEEERRNFLLAMEKGKTTCEHCGLITTKGNYKRWHGDNCKAKKSND